jgi:MFS family permease
MTMVQGAIAEDLDAHENPMWLSTSYFIPVSALAPFVGRLATIFPARALLLPISVLIAIGSLVSAFAQTATMFIAGRAIAGAGSAGVLSLIVVFVLEMTTGKNRGIMVGLVNAGMTVGVSAGAIMFGALLPVIGWVSRKLFSYQILDMLTYQSAHCSGHKPQYHCFPALLRMLAFQTPQSQAVQTQNRLIRS